MKINSWTTILLICFAIAMGLIFIVYQMNIRLKFEQFIGLLVFALFIAGVFIWLLLKGMQRKKKTLIEAGRIIIKQMGEEFNLNLHWKNTPAAAEQKFFSALNGMFYGYDMQDEENSHFLIFWDVENDQIARWIKSPVATEIRSPFAFWNPIEEKKQTPKEVYVEPVKKVVGSNYGDEITPGGEGENV